VHLAQDGKRNAELMHPYPSSLYHRSQCHIHALCFVASRQTSQLLSVSEDNWILFRPNHWYFERKAKGVEVKAQT
jgi:hypothetical protein